MNERPQKKSGNGFVLGLIIGGLIVFLFGTRKGRKLLRAISDTGVELVDRMGSVNCDDEYKVPDQIDEENQEQELDQDVQTENMDDASSQNGNGNASKKRFFRGIKK